MEGKIIHRIKTINEFHQFRNLPKPVHPLISVIDFDAIKHLPGNSLTGLMLELYSISLKRTSNTKIKYGQQEYDFDEGVLFFMAPCQVFGIETYKNAESEHTGWLLLIHPDFLWNTSLAGKIKSYDFFDYAANEALFLSEKEEGVINVIIENIRQELYSNIDNFSQDIIVAQVETLLNYSERFYHRQFITRKITNHGILDRMEKLLSNYFSGDDLATKGLPTVQYISEKLNVSPGYLSNLLKVLTGQSTQQHIHNKLIEKAKEKLSATNLSVSEIAYELGFEHSQSFSKLFKGKTSQTPLEFRRSFN